MNVLSKILLSGTAFIYNISLSSTISPFVVTYFVVETSCVGTALFWADLKIQEVPKLPNTSPSTIPPNVSKNLETNCESIEGCFLDSKDDNCQCEVFVEDTMAYQSVSDLSTGGDLLSTATIGAFVPDDAIFIATGSDSIKQFPGGPLSIDTIFKVSDSSGRSHYLKNVRSTANLGDGSLQMRNPVTFYSLSDPTIRDAEYELDATLEHYFFHQNVPMFMARRLAQRFGSSNPSPRYIQVIAKSFRTGMYESFGSNQYGCLEATIAAILLDRESKDHILDADPFQ